VLQGQTLTTELALNRVICKQKALSRTPVLLLIAGENNAALTNHTIFAFHYFLNLSLCSFIN
jgi:hypothetical protein